METNVNVPALEPDLQAALEPVIEQSVSVPEALDITLSMLDNIEDNLNMMSDEIAAQVDEIESLRDVILAIKAAVEEDED